MCERRKNSFMTGSMCSLNILSLICVATVVSFVTLVVHGSVETRKVYIVYMGSLDENDHQTLSSTHFSMLQHVVDIRFTEKFLVRSYTRSFNGFAANLTAKECQELAKNREILSIFPSRKYQTQTTRSWDFMGFSENIQRSPSIESDIIIGMIDAGIWPESPSFSDVGFGPPPRKWKGACSGGKNFTCNNKLIGARYYNSDHWSFTGTSARDRDGHGTHTSSIAAGNHVPKASFFGIAKGTARGGVPSARIAAYNACSFRCESVDILAAFDDAIADGVDIISISIGGRAQPLEEDVFALGSFHAIQKGILVIQPAGNGQLRKSCGSTAPWIFSVAASTTDRGIISKVVLGDGTTLSGRSVNNYKLKGTTFPLVYGKNIQSSECTDVERIEMCDNGCLMNTTAKGKIVLCASYEGIGEAIDAGCIGSITRTSSLTTQNVSDVLPSPTSLLNENDFHVVESYIRSTKTPTVDILTSESIRNLNAPEVAIFSSRGPNSIIPDILKPDITAPGVEILAAFPSEISLTKYPDDKRSTNFSVLSGTSMACPHVSGAAAYVKSLHPDWSPSAIKSALMTTAMKMKDPDAEFSYGSGHINPVKAANPGLVYEILVEDYTKMICGFGNAKKAFGVNCSKGVILLPKDLNYPSMTIRIKKSRSKMSTHFSGTFTRTLTNVGFATSTYTATTTKSSYYNISVNPSELKFRALNEKKSFQVIISGEMKKTTISASLEWYDGVHNVRSPIVVYLDD